VDETDKIVIEGSTDKLTNSFASVGVVSDVVKKTEAMVDNYVDPVRRSVFRRYPVLFSGLVSIGAVSTFLGLERLILQFDILEKYPILILVFGMSLLLFTGKLYTKLG
jgi:hypothetical protein